MGLLRHEWVRSFQADDYTLFTNKPVGKGWSRAELTRMNSGEGECERVCIWMKTRDGMEGERVRE